MYCRTQAVAESCILHARFGQLVRFKNSEIDLIFLKPGAQIIAVIISKVFFAVFVRNDPF